MKRTLVTLFLLALSSVCWGQSKPEQIAAIKDTIATLEQGYAPLQDRLHENDKLADSIKFTAESYTKAYDQFKSDLANFNTEQDNVNRAYDLLQPAMDNYLQRKAQHNANRCTAVQGSGACDWYNKEADSIDAQRNQIVAVKDPLDQRQAALDQRKTNLQQTQQQLTEIYNNQVANYDKWKAEQESIKSSYLELKAKIDDLNKQLAALYGSLSSCLKEIPPSCAKPATGPDGKPILDQNCEIMKRQCSNMFDGSK